MKQTIISVSIAVLIIVVSITLISIDVRSARKTELERAVSAAVKQTVEMSRDERHDMMNSDREMAAEFVHILSLNISSKSDISVEVMGIDHSEGMLDVLVTEKFNFPDGNTEEISVRKCAISE